MAKPCPSEFTGRVCFRSRFPGRCQVPALAFPPLPPFCTTSFSAGWLAPWGGKQESRRELLARAESEFQSVFVPAALGSSLPAQLLLESRAGRPAICSVTSQEEEAGRGRMVSVWFVCLPLPLLYLAECCSCLLTLSMLPERSFVNAPGVWKPSSQL